MLRRSLLVAAMVAIALPVTIVGSAVPSVAAPGDLAPTHPMPVRSLTRVDGLPAPSSSRAKPAGNGINYNGGPVLLGTPKAYIVWYGDWSLTDSATKQSIITDFLGSVGGSPWLNIDTTYYNGAGTRVSNAVSFAGATSDPGSQGLTNLSDAAIGAVVSGAIGGGALPKDPNGVYFVLTAPNVTKSGFLTQYCGWHTHGTIGGSDIKYSFVGDPTGPSLSNCATQTTSSPNGNPAADAMVSVIAHELVETVTDPDLNAWYDNRGYENADKCAWTFGTTSTAPNGSKYNMTLGTRQYLVQRNWVNASGGYCSLSY